MSNILSALARGEFYINFVIDESDWDVKYDLLPALDAIEKATERLKRKIEEAQSDGDSGNSPRLH